MYRYSAELVKVIDGDTIDFDLDLGFYIKKRVRVRVRDYNAPEIRGVDKEQGLIYKARAKQILENCFYIVVETSKDTSFDRWIGVVYVDGKDFRELMNKTTGE